MNGKLPSVTAWILLSLPLAIQPIYCQSFEVTPLFGFRVGGDFRLQPDGPRPYAIAALSNTASYGFAAGMKLDDESAVEFRWIRQGTKLRLPDLSGQPGNTYLNTSINTFHGDFTHEFATEWESVRPFLTGSVGASRIATPAQGSTRFSFGFGTGAKVNLTRRFGLRFNAQYIGILVSPEIRGVVCAGGCVAVIGGRVTSQLDFSVGPTFRF
jgi:hypothetical protein